jgi:hypothetical protein
MATTKKRSAGQKPSALRIASIERRSILFAATKLSWMPIWLGSMVPTSRLNEQVKRNRSRFPKDFMFQLSKEETVVLISQNAISSVAPGGRRNRPFAFTEQGVAMLSSVLKSERAVQVNIAIMRAFVQIRAILATYHELAERLQELEGKFQQHDAQIQEVFEAIRALLAPQLNPGKRRIEFPA